MVNTKDKYHLLVRNFSLRVKPPFLTTEAVLIEIGNGLSKPKSRALAIETIEDLRSDPVRVEVLPVDTTLFDRSFALYRSRRDKTWGITDRISFVVMQERGIRQVLTTDEHFEQAGFQNLLTIRR